MENSPTSVTPSGVAAVRHPDHFKPLMDSIATELLDRRGAGLNPWLEQRYRPFRFEDSRDDARANRAISPECASGIHEATRG